MVVRMGGVVFRPGLWPTVVTLVLLALLVTLGFWQLSRAEQKRELLAAYGDLPLDAPVRLNEDFRLGPDWRFRRAQVRGRFDAEHQFLLDNRVHQGRVGYFVLTPLRLAQSDHAILVNRGWVPQGATREDLPALPLPDAAAPVTLAGLIDFPPEHVFMLGEGEGRDPGWPKVLQRVRLPVQAEQLGVPLLPALLLLDPADPAGFVRDWHPVVFGPERHVGYAVQWFALALVLAMLYLWVNIERPDGAGEQRGRDSE